MGTGPRSRQTRWAFYDKFRPTVDRKGWVTERQTSRVADVLQRRLDDLDGPRRNRAEHPHNVFATESVSDHTEGRGVGIWAIDGQPVVSLRDPGGPRPALVQTLVDAKLTEVGSPFDVDGAGGASFTNTVHQDHLHVAFDG